MAIDLPRRTCVPIGGGKDSIVTLECLKRAGEDLVLFSLGDAEPIAACIAAAGLPFFRVHRRLDPALFKLNEQGALNGHVPITGILSAIATACAVLVGFDTVAMSNEHSASAPTLIFDGFGINHQYSKSLEFEVDLADYVARCITPSIAYFSLLRPLAEIEIARRFAQYPKYFDIFRSCNTAFRQSPAERGHHWCGNCPKCRFVFLALAPFVGKDRLIAIFGHNILDDETQADGFAELCGLREHKPFECVGEIHESAAVMAHLGSDPGWRDDAVVRRLHSAFPSLQRLDPARTSHIARDPASAPGSEFIYGDVGCVRLSSVQRGWGSGSSVARVALQSDSCARATRDCHCCCWTMRAMRRRHASSTIFTALLARTRSTAPSGKSMCWSNLPVSGFTGLKLKRRAATGWLSPRY